jgi:XTP/dITP diphosphohydrolase
VNSARWPVTRSSQENTETETWKYEKPNYSKRSTSSNLCAFVPVALCLFKTMKIVIATTNQNKLRELKDLLQGFDVELLSLKDFSEHPVVVEDGESFAENALKKARAICAHTGLVTIADDSGLEVDSLSGHPGIYSARYAGDRASDRENYKKLLRKLKGVAPEKRGARFCCVLAIVSPSGTEKVVTGEYRGVIIDEPRGHNGFGYDPVFLDPASGLTFAEMEPEQKNRISHRAQALHELRKILPDFLGMVSQ